MERICQKINLSRSRTSRQEGFTLIELLVTISIFTVVAAGMFGFLFAATRDWQKNSNIADMTENARLGLNRMTREIRQASNIINSQSNHVSFVVNFTGTSPETVTYGFDPGTADQPGTIWRESTAQGSERVTLVNDVQNVQFDYFGNDYRCDTSPYDGVITYSELQACGAAPTGIARVDISLTLQTGKESPQVFKDQAWLRNRTVGVANGEHEDH